MPPTVTEISSVSDILLYQILTIKLLHVVQYLGKIIKNMYTLWTFILTFSMFYYLSKCISVIPSSNYYRVQITYFVNG